MFGDSVMICGQLIDDVYDQKRGIPQTVFFFSNH